MANNPTLLKMPLATDGEKATIPETTGSTTGKFSQQYGFQAINALPLQAGGVAPKREDFNGAFNLLGGVAFYAQKGWVFEYDSAQDYYKGCIVTDPADGNKYECIADMAAGTIAPHSDTSNTYWKDANFLIKQLTPAYNHRDEITTSGTYTAPVTGWYKITLKGGGGGGGGAHLRLSSSSKLYAISGFGGNEGAITVKYKHLTAGTSCAISIGAGGGGGHSNAGTTNSSTSGSDGGNTSVTISGETYTASGGGGGGGTPPTVNGLAGDVGGSRVAGYIGGATFSVAVVGGNGGGAGGLSFSANASVLNGQMGGGGAGGGTNTDNTVYNGGTGGNGYVWFEYWED